MSTNEYVEAILQMKGEAPPTQAVDEAAVYEAAQLLSGSFTYPLYEALLTNFFEMDDVTQHLEHLYDSGNFYGFVYFVFILANAVDFTIPTVFTEMSANEALVPVLAAAIIEDWLEYDISCNVTEIDV